MVDNKVVIENMISNVKTLRESLKSVTAEFITYSDYDEAHDIIYDMPRVYEVSKYGIHIEYVILGIENGVVHCGGIGEDYGNTMSSTIDALYIDELIGIADNL